MKTTTSTRKRLIFDTGALIAAARTKAGPRLVLDDILACADILISPTVKTEAIDQDLASGYPDALVLDKRVKAGAIVVRSAVLFEPVFERVVKAYEVEAGDEEVLILCRAIRDYDHFVVDDRLLYIIAHRLDLHPLFLPDLIVLLAREGGITIDRAEAILNALKPRYRPGFIEHAFQALKGAI
jgi:hypothetical protein